VGCGPAWDTLRLRAMGLRVRGLDRSRGMLAQARQRGDLPPVKLTWYQGTDKPELWKQGKIPQFGNGVLFIGDKGMLLSDYGKHVLLPEKEFAEYQRPAKSIPDSIGHHVEWVASCFCRHRHAGGDQPRNRACRTD